MPRLKTTIEIEIEIEFDYQKAEQATRGYPGCSEEIYITNIHRLLLWPNHYDEIEDLIWANRDSWEED